VAQRGQQTLLNGLPFFIFSGVHFGVLERRGIFAD